MGSSVVGCRLSCFAACRMLVQPPEIEPMTALQGAFLTRGPPRKSRKEMFIVRKGTDTGASLHGLQSYLDF